MGRYENAVKFVRLGNLLEEKKYEEALVIAEELEGSKISDVSDLKVLADAYRRCGKYDKAKKFYQIICEEYRTRKNMYTLIMMCIKSGSNEEAESLYQEYITIDKNSIYKYILRYRIDKSKGADRQVIIKDLQDIKREFYMEEWAYELAKQYHKAGMIEECIEECKDIILWFGEGEIVEKAKLLCMHYDNSVEGDIMQTLQMGIGNEVSRYMQETSIEDDEEADVNTDENAEDNAEDNLDENTDDNTDDKDEVIADEEPKEIEKSDSRGKMLESALSMAAGIKNAMKDAHGDAFNYVPAEELYSMLDAGIDPYGNYVVALEDNDNAANLVKEIANRIRKQGILNDPKIARISAQKLNEISIEEQINGLLGVCVLVENAAAMSNKTVNGIIRLLDAHSGEVIFIFVDKKDRISRFLFREEMLNKLIKYYAVL